MGASDMVPMPQEAPGTWGTWFPMPGPHNLTSGHQPRPAHLVGTVFPEVVHFILDKLLEKVSCAVQGPQDCSHTPSLPDTQACTLCS